MNIELLVILAAVAGALGYFVSVGLAALLILAVLLLLLVHRQRL